MTDRRVTVGKWADIEHAPQLSHRDKQRVATIFTEQSWDHVVWIPEWLLEDDDHVIQTVESSDHLAVGEVEDYSEKAWEFKQPHIDLGVTELAEQYLPKSQVIVFERVPGIEEIETPQRGLTSFTEGAHD